MKIFIIALLLAASSLLLHSCGSLFLTSAFPHNLSITILHDTTRTEIIEWFFVDNFKVLHRRSSFDKEGGIVKVDDHHFLLAAYPTSDSGRVALYDDSLRTVWENVYALREKEYTPHLWSYRNTINVISISVEEDSSALLARSFDHRTGMLRTTRALFSVEDRFNAVRFVASPDSSLLLAILDSENDDDEQITTLLLLQSDFTIVQQSTLPTSSVPSNFAVANNGDIVYAHHSELDTALLLSLVRLSLHNTQWDTLSVSTQRSTADGDEIEANDCKITCVGDSFLLAWSLEEDGEAVSIHLSRFDFRTHTASVVSNFVFDERTVTALFNDNTLGNSHIVDVIPLADGGVVTLFSQCTPVKSGGGGGGMRLGGGPIPRPGGGSISVPAIYSSAAPSIFLGDYRTRWLAAVCTNKDGSIRWQKAEDRVYRGARQSGMSGSSITNNILHVLVLDGGVPLEVLFSLTDGSTSIAGVLLDEDDVDYKAACLPALTIWNKNQTAVLVLLGKDEGYLARIPTHTPHWLSGSK